MRRKSPTSAWRRSISSTKKTSVTPCQACNLLHSEAAAADTAAEAAEAAAAFEPAEEAAEPLALPAAAAALEAAAAAEAAAGEAAAAAEAVAGAGAGVAAAACRGEVAPSGVRLERLAITLTDPRRHGRV
jgi:hypothetical protein